MRFSYVLWNTLFAEGLVDRVKDYWLGEMFLAETLTNFALELGRLLGKLLVRVLSLRRITLALELGWNKIEGGVLILTVRLVLSLVVASVVVLVWLLL